MHDRFLMCVLHRRAHSPKQRQAFAYRKMRSVFEQRPALYILHHEVRQTIVACAAVQQACNVWMLQPGQDLTLSAEAAESCLCVSAPFDQFDGYLHGKVIFTHRAIDYAHATLTNKTCDRVMAKFLADLLGGLIRIRWQPLE